MSQQELLEIVVAFFHQHSIGYLVSGSIASSLQGEPRATHDVDLVVDVKKETIPLLVNAFPPPDYYLSSEAMQEAIERKSMFNLLHAASGNKVDFWLLSNEPFDQKRFERRYLETIPGLSLYVSSPEDTIVMKLKWCKLAGGSEKQMNDARSVYELQFARLDLSYIQHWVFELELQELWTDLVTTANPIT